jgi:hypothetical protein
VSFPLGPRKRRKRYPRYAGPDFKPTAEQQAERDAVQRDHRLRVSPGAKYYPAKIVVDAPVLDDGRLDVRAWLAMLDKACNEATP